MQSPALLPALCLAAVAASADPAWTFGTDGDGRLELVAAADAESEAIDVPEDLEGEPVLSIGPRAFSGCPMLREVGVPAGVLWIDPDAFADCPSLEWILVAPGNGVYADADGVLFDAARLLLLTCPEGRTGDYSVPEGAEEIDSGAFSGCAKVTSVMFPPSLKRTGTNVFAGCTALATLAIPYDAAYDTGELGLPEECGVVRYGEPVRYTVRFHANGGTGTMDDEAFVVGTPKKLPKNAFSRTGYKFVGWAKKKGGPAVYKNAQSVLNLASAPKTIVHLYAVWSVGKYKVRFEPNGGSGKTASQSFVYGKSKRLRLNGFTRSGFVFEGWATTKKAAVAGKAAYADGASMKDFVAKKSSVRLWAVWKKIRPKKAGRIRFALCQTPCGRFSASERIDKTIDWVRQSLNGDEDVIVFPELAFTTFSKLKTAHRNGPAVWKKIAAFAREQRAYVVANHPNRTGGSSSKMYNETRIYGPDGLLVGVYRKRVLAIMDAKAGFSAGPAAVPVNLPFARIGIMICKDAFTPSKGKDRYKGADLLLAQFAHPGVDDRSVPEAKGYFSTTKRSRKQVRESYRGWNDLGKPYLAVNKAGPDGNYQLAGGSVAATKAGKIVAKAGAGEKVLFVEFPLKRNGRIKPTPVSKSAK